MGEKNNLNKRCSPVDIIAQTGLEMTRDRPKLFLRGETISIREMELTEATVMSKHGFSAQRLKENLGKLHTYVLLDREADIQINKYGEGGNKKIAQGYLFWARK